MNFKIYNAFKYNYLLNLEFPRFFAERDLGARRAHLSPKLRAGKNDLYRVPYVCGLLITEAIEGCTSIVEYALNHVELSLMDCKFALECVASFRHVEVMDKLLPRTGAQATDYFLPGTNQEGNWREAPMELVPRTSQENARNIQQIFSGMKFTRLEAFIAD
jgi:hypothetical protein